jgi:hypothetical protein
MGQEAGRLAGLMDDPLERRGITAGPAGRHPTSLPVKGRANPQVAP